MSAYINIPKIESRFNFSDKRNKVIEMPNHNKIRTFERYDEDGKLILRGESLNGKLHGKGIVFYKNRNIHCIIHYKDGEMDGLAQGYYPHWNEKRSFTQKNGYSIWRKANRNKKIVIIEICASKTIPTIRNFNNNYSKRHENIRLVRINPVESEVLNNGNTRIFQGIISLDMIKKVV